MGQMTTFFARIVLIVTLAMAGASGTSIGLKPGLLGSSLPVHKSTVSVIRGPYLQMGTATSIIVHWRTDQGATSRVLYGLSPNQLRTSVASPVATTDHSVTLSGLSPATKYYYAVGTDTDILAGGDSLHFFETAPSPGQPHSVRIWVLGDSGTGDWNAQRVRDGYYAFTGARYTDLWLMLGDNAYERGTDAEYQVAVFDTYPDTLRTSALWPTFGNHDALSASSWTQSGPYYDVFSLPTNGEAGGVPSGTEAYYSFDFANIHFVVLDAEDMAWQNPNSMLTWLQADLSNTTQDWIIAFWHRPPYSKGNHDSDSEANSVRMRSLFVPVLEAYGVDLVLSGHSHAYERSFLLDGHYGLSSTLTSAMIKDGGDGRPSGDGAYSKVYGPHGGTVYIVSGSSGRLTVGPLDHLSLIHI